MTGTAGAAKFAYSRPDEKNSLNFPFSRKPGILEETIKIGRSAGELPAPTKTVRLEIGEFASGLLCVCSGDVFGLSSGVLGDFMPSVKLTEAARVYFLERDKNGVTWTTVESTQRDMKGVVFEYSTLVDASKDILRLDHYRFSIPCQDGRRFGFEFSTFDGVAIALGDNRVTLTLDGKIPIKHGSSETEMRDSVRSLLGFDIGDRLDIQKVITNIGLNMSKSGVMLSDFLQ